MKKEIQCPFCKGRNLQVNKTNLGIMGYYCYRCGCNFVEGEYYQKGEPKEITKEEFFDIIFTAIKEIMDQDELDEVVCTEIESQFNTVQVYYQQIAESYAAALYELDCDDKERELKKLIFSE